MSVVSLLNVDVLNNPARFADKYKLEITFECLEPLSKDLEWKLTYVGSATSSEHDIVLDSLLVGPIPVGVNKFIFEADPPNPANIPSSELVGVTVVLLTCSYDDREFVRVGYYVNNEYDTPELNENPPSKPLVDRLVRNMLSEKPRVTRFAIKWDSEDSAPAEFPPEQPEADAAPDDEDKYAADELDDEDDEEEVAADGEGDTEMGGAEDTAGGPAEEDLGEESEDLELESEDDEEDDEDEDEVMETDPKPEDPAAPAIAGAVAPGPGVAPVS